VSKRRLAAAVAAALVSVTRITAGAVAAPELGAQVSAKSSANSPGFAPDNESPFLPVIQLAPPGPNRAARAVAIFERILALQRKVMFHPEFAESIDPMLDHLSPRQSTLIRAAALYSDSDVPWIVQPGGIHQICITGEPRGADYYYSLAHACDVQAPMDHFLGTFSLKPIVAGNDGKISSVIGNIGGQMTVDTVGLGGVIDAGAATLRYDHGDLKAPWDTVAGEFNHHDRAALELFHRQTPHIAAVCDRYADYRNILDEFDSPSGPVVLFNLDFDVRRDALEKYPHLKKFFDQLADSVSARSAITDPQGNFWAKFAFDHGRIRVTFMDRSGLLAPFDANYRPAGAGIAIEKMNGGNYHTTASVRVTALGMDFGLDNLSFATEFTREAHEVKFENRMDSAPVLIAPPGIHKVIDIIAGQFLQTLATGSGGMRTHARSNDSGDGAIKLEAGSHAELAYSPALGFLARIGDALAEAENDNVRSEERALGQEFFDAFVADYNDARPAILSTDAKAK